MRKLVKAPGKLKALALGAGLASLLLGAWPAAAANYYYYNSDPGTGGTLLAPDAPGSLPSWLSGYFNADGLWVTDKYAENILTVDYGGSAAPQFALGGVELDNPPDGARIAGNQIHYRGGNSPAGILIGGLGQTLSAEGNKIYYTGGGLEGYAIFYNLSGDSQKYAVIGGAAEGGAAQANKNEVHITGTGDIYGSVVGGLIFGSGSAGGVSGNSVAIAGYTGDIDGSVIGGSAEGGAAAKNTVRIDGTGQTVTVYGDVIGNRSTDGSALGVGEEAEWDVYLTGGQVDGSVAGGLVTAGTSLASAASGHRVLIDGAAIGDRLYGGWVQGGIGTAQGNKVTILAGDGPYTCSYVHGGWVASGAALDNEVLLVGANMGLALIGGEVDGDGTAEGNKVTMAGGSADDNVIGGVVYGIGNATGNTVWIDGGAVSGGVYGGYVANDGEASGNKILIQGGAVDGGVYGGFVGGNGSASKNEVRLEGVTVNGDVYGGNIGAGEASGNQVWIEGGTMNAVMVMGGYIDAAGDENKAENNIITLTGAITFNGTEICGHDGGGITHQGNTLNLYNLAQAGSGIDSIGNFDEYNFKIDRGKIGSFALTATDVDLTGAQVKSIAITGGGAKLADYTAINLIDAANSLTADAYAGAGQTVQGTQGVSLVYDLQVAAGSGQQLTATVLASHVNPETKALSEGWLAGPAFLNQAADLLEKEAVKEAGLQAWREQGPAVFAAMGYSDARHNTGSHVDVKGPSLVVGLANAQETAQGGRLTYGGFVEAGWGDYDSYNSFGTGEVRGSGDTSYQGLGILVRADKAKRGQGHLYAEGSLRAGRVKTDFAQQGGLNAGAAYQAKSAYYGLHIGLGYIKELKGDSSLDLYTKLLYTRAGSDSITVQGDPIELDAVSSVRWRTGLRYSKAAGEKSEFYAGLAYDHEFDGKARGRANGMAIDAPGLKGGTGIGELGVIFKGKNLHIDLKLEGYAGKREGFGGGVQFKWLF